MPGPFPFKQILADDPSNPAMVARNGEILLFAPGDTTMTPLVIWNLSHTIQLPNPVTVNDLGFGPAFIHDTLDQVAWSGGGLNGTFESYRGMKDVATAAEASSESSANSSAQSADSAAAAAALVDAPADTITAILMSNPESATGKAIDAATSSATAAMVPPLVVTALAADSTPADAAAAAVDNALAGLDVLEAVTLNADAEKVAFGVVDKDNRRTWIEASTGGAPSEYAKSHISAASGTGQFKDGSLSFAVVDSSGRVAELRTDAKGQIPSDVLAAWQGRMGVQSSTIFPTKDWAFWGDSMVGAVWPTRFGTALGGGVKVYAGGLGSQGTRQIAARQGGVPLLVTATSNTIPAIGSVEITLSTPIVTYAGSGVGSKIEGYIAGIRGYIVKTTTAHEFQRMDAGPAVAIPERSPFTPVDALTNRSRHAVMWPFRNSVATNAPYAETASTMVSMVRQMIEYTSAQVKRVIVIECLPAAIEPIGSAARAVLDSFNAAAKSALGPYWADGLADYLRSDAAATRAGITLTANDRTDISNGLIPRQLMPDGTHLLEPAGNDLVIYWLQQQAQLRGWI